MKLIFLYTTLFFISTLKIYAQDSSFVHFSFNADSAYLVIDNEFDEIIKIQNNQAVKLLVGNRYISLGLPNKAVKKFYMMVLKDSTTSKEVTFDDLGLSIENLRNNFAAAAFFEANIMIISEPDTEIMYEDSLLGIGFTTFRSNDRFPEFQFKDNQGRISDISTKIYGQFTVLEHNVRPSKYYSRSVSFIPGASQWYKNQKIKSLGFILGTTGLSISYLLAKNSYETEREKYYTILDTYQTSVNEIETLELGNKLEDDAHTLKLLDNRRRIFLGLTILTYVGNIFDSFLSTPKGGYSNPKPLNFYLDNILIDGNHISTATLKVNLNSLK